MRSSSPSRSRQQPCDTVWQNARLASMAGDGVGLVDDGVVACREGTIVYAGDAAHAPEFAAARRISCDGRLMTPGLIDCHTHLVYGGNRVKEHELRNTGRTYEEIAAAGGGIWSTVDATRSATDEQLLAAALARLDALIAEGVSTVEVKSGYGLTLDHELRLLRVARQLGRERNVKVVTTLLAAHAVPPEYASNPDRYVDLVCEEMIPAATQGGLADAVDVFCERIAFSLAQAERIFQAAKASGLAVKIHAEQLSNSHGARLAARHGALSADHLEYLDEEGIAAMARSATVATLLPGAFYFLAEKKRPPVRGLREARVPIAVATDCNPGTSPLSSILTAMNMASVLFGMSVEECLAGVTRNAARALGIAETHGTLEAGKACDLALWDVSDPAELIYHIGLNPLHARIRGGQ